MSQSDFVTRGQALVSAGQFQEAVKVCRLGLLGRPTTVEGRVVLGQALLALKRFDEVLAEMRVALELDHSSVAAQVLKAEALLRKGDGHAAMDVLQRVRTTAPSDPKIAQLIAEGERSLGRPNVSATHPSVGFVGGMANATFSSEESTKHYPHHGATERTDEDELDDTGGSFTRPTSLQTSKRSPLPADATPPPAVLAVGDRSGTVDIDPDLDGVELGNDDDFGELAAPPRARGVPLPGVRRSRALDDRSNPDARGQVIPARKRNVNAVVGAMAAKRSRHNPKEDVSTVELDDDEMIEIDESEPPRKAGPGPATAVRNAVKMPSGPIDAGPALSHAAARPTMHQAVVAPPPHLAQLMAQQQQQPMGFPPPPAHMHPSVQPPPGMQPRNPIAAAMPTMAAPMPMGMPLHPQMQPMPQMPMSSAAARPTMALNAAQQQSGRRGRGDVRSADGCAGRAPGHGDGAGHGSQHGPDRVARSDPAARPDRSADPGDVRSAVDVGRDAARRDQPVGGQGAEDRDAPRALQAADRAVVRDRWARDRRRCVRRVPDPRDPAQVADQRGPHPGDRRCQGGHLEGLDRSARSPGRHRAGIGDPG
ncbi:MAG: hypothetical protein WKG01_28825 [Kofleriaceae bacterium]